MWTQAWKNHHGADINILDQSIRIEDEEIGLASKRAQGKEYPKSGAQHVLRGEDMIVPDIKKSIADANVLPLKMRCSKR